MKTPFQLLLFFVLLSASPAALHSQAIWRVHPGGDDENSGATWAESFRSLQRAIDAAVAGDTIWVAAGTYLPSCTESGDCSDSLNRDNTFFFDFDVAVYGGFPATGDPGWDDRDWETHESILSGDLAPQVRAYTVVHTRSLSSAFIMDGFTITRGNADFSGGDIFFQRKRGGGWFNLGTSSQTSNPTIKNCMFVDNYAAHQGGAMYNEYGDLMIENCVFTENRAGIGGGGAIYNFQSNYNLIGCTFTSNGRALTYGGAIYNRSSNQPKLEGCIFRENFGVNGGVVYNSSSNGEYFDCIFDNNSGNFAGLMHNHVSNPRFFNCIFKRNRNLTDYGLMQNGSSSPEFYNCLFLDNNNESILVMILNTYAEGLYTIPSNPLMVNCTFTRNGTSFFPYPLIENILGNPVLINCIFWNNYVSELISDSSPSSHTSVSYSIIQGGWPGEGNLDTDPLFADPATEDYRLSHCSPAINAGNPDTSGLMIPLADLANDPRFFNGIIDMGAYEFQDDYSPGPDSIVSISACESYSLNETTYTESGEYLQLMPGVEACTLFTLQLTVNHHTAETMWVEICDSYTLNGVTYTESGTHVQTLVNEVGCDSTLTLNLSVLNTSETLFASGCDSLVFNGEVFTGSGVFTQILTNENGCDSTLTLHLTIGSPFDILVFHNGNVLAASTPNAAYQWIDCATGEEIPGATNPFFIVPEDGSYAVLVTQEGCSVLSDCVDVVIVSAGEAEAAPEEARVFPNPAQERFTLSLPWEAEARLHDTVGRLVWSGWFETGERTVDSEQWPPGVYMLTLLGREAVQTLRIFKF
jgi:hypothetical protein